MRRNVSLLTGTVLLASVLFCASLVSQQAAPAPVAAAANLTLPAASAPLAADTFLDPGTPAWGRIAVRRLALNRTPPLYDTDPPAELEIPVVEVRVVRASNQLMVHLTWRDRSYDAATLAQVPTVPPEERDHKELTAATSRFFDGVAVMYPSGSPGGTFTPSLQMGDVGQPVLIYYWNAARGAMLMEAAGRGTTRRTGESFPARGVYRGGVWRVALQLPDLPAGVPLAFAVWNGAQQDRDGRKYFSVWHWLE